MTVYKQGVSLAGGSNKKAAWDAIKRLEQIKATMPWPAWKMANDVLEGGNSKFIKLFKRREAQDIWDALPARAKAKIIAARSVGAVRSVISRLPRWATKGLPILGWGLTVIEVADFLADTYYDNYGGGRLNPDDEEIEDIEQRFKDVSEPWDPETQTFPSEREEEESVRVRLQGTRN